MALLGYSWKYINEGNAHIVLQLQNTQSVVRLIKEDERPLDYRDIKKSVDFVNNVMNPLLFGCNEIQEIVVLSNDELTQLRSNLHKLRPKHRIEKNKYFFSRNAIKTPNLAILNPVLKSNYCIEIKPKEGFLPPNLKPYGKCYYCLKQHLKLRDKQISSLSNYCPLDFFSGQKNRMKKALCSLAQNPQNNFKIFHDCELIYDEYSTMDIFNQCIKDTKIFINSDQFFEFIIEILLSQCTGRNIIPLTGSKIVTESNHSEECFENYNLPKTSYLYEILNLQNLNKSCDFYSECLSTEDTDYVQACLEFLKVNKLNLKNDRDAQFFLENANKFSLAMISAIVRDCSLMITFSQNFIDGLSCVDLNGQLIPFKVSVTDLEPKQQCTLAKRVANERKLLKIYEQSFCSKKSNHMQKPE